MKLEWPWNRFPDNRSQWETCLKEHKKALAEIETLRAKLYPNTVAREKDPMQPAGSKYEAHRKYFGDD